MVWALFCNFWGGVEGVVLLGNDGSMVHARVQVGEWCGHDLGEGVWWVVV